MGRLLQPEKGNCHLGIRTSLETKTLLRGAYHRIREYPRETYIRARKKLRQGKPTAQYNTAPKVTAIIQCHNKANVVGKIVKRLQESGIEEIIGIDDGSIDGTTGALQNTLTRPNDFVLRANDIWEVRTYNRAMQMAAGELIVLLQDDDLPPKDAGWIRTALEAFLDDSELAVLGGRGGFNWHHDASSNYLHANPVDASGNHSSWIPCDTVNRAPMWIRASIAKQLDFLDDAFAPTFYDDADYCFRAKKAGHRVGVYDANFGRASRSGMLAYNNDAQSELISANRELLLKRHADAMRHGLHD